MLQRPSLLRPRIIAGSAGLGSRFAGAGLQAGIGRYLAAGSPMRFAGLPAQPVRPAPTLGEHGATIASQDLGRSDEEVAALRAAGILSTP